MDQRITDKRLLLVDDDEGIRRVLGISLADTGYEVFTASNGEEALNIFRKVHPPIVLTDIKMPGMDGIELLRSVKHENPDTEVIMITGHGDMDLAIKSLKHDAVDFVTKPINEDVLEIALNRAHEKIFMRRKLAEYTENLEVLVQKKSAKLVEAERQTAVGQAIEGFSSASRRLASDLDSGIPYFNEMPCFVSIHNQDQKVAAINQLYRERLGDKTGKKSDDIYKKTETDRFKSAVNRTFQTGKGQRTKATVEYADGTEGQVMIHTAPIRDRSGNVGLVLEISADISEVKRLRDQLRDTQKRYQQLFDEVPCYISVQDRDLQIIGSNKRFKDHFDHKAGRYCYEIYKHRDEPCPDCPVAKTFLDGRSHPAEMVVTSKSGEQYHVLIWTAPLFDAYGEITQVMEMSTNITQIRRLQDHLSSLGLKISSISHGIKGLLAGLDGGMYLVESGFTKENRQRMTEGWEIVKTISNRIRKMVLDILYFAKERELNRERTDVLDFVRDVADAMEPKITAQHIEFVCEFDEFMGEIEMDINFIRSALINLLENALDACMEDHGHKLHKIIFRVSRNEDQILFEVRDNGIGMDQETKESLFTLFFSSKGNKGTGLGLFITHKIIEQHGGKIRVDATLGEGSRFMIQIPRVISESKKKGFNDA